MLIRVYHQQSWRIEYLLIVPQKKPDSTDSTEILLQCENHLFELLWDDVTVTKNWTSLHQQDPLRPAEMFQTAGSLGLQPSIKVTGEP